MESRPNPGPATLRHHDAVIGCLRKGGFTVPAAAHAYSVLDSYLYGFVLQSTNLPIQTPSQVEQVGTAMLSALPAEEYPGGGHRRRNGGCLAPIPIRAQA
jgi:hypothetical protein